MKRTSRDRLDGTEKKSWVKEIFLVPGRLILWFNYMFPAKGMQNITKSARHAKSPIMTWFYSIVFWATSIFLLFAIIVSEAPV